MRARCVDSSEYQANLLLSNPLPCYPWGAKWTPYETSRVDHLKRVRWKRKEPPKGEHERTQLTKKTLHPEKSASVYEAQWDA